MAIGTPWIGTAVQGNVAGSNATTVTLDITAAPTGEVVWIFGTVGDSQTAAMTAPSGWTILGQQSEGTSGGSSSRTIIMWKVKATTDTTVIIPTWPVTTKPQFVAMCWPGVDPTTPAEGLTWLAHTSGASYDTGTATPTAANRVAVGVFSSRGTTATVAWSNSTLTQRIGVIDTASVFVGLSVADSNGAVTQASHTYTATGQTASHGLGAVLYLIPASPSTAPVVANVTSANSNSAGYPVNVPPGTVNGDLLIGAVASDFGTFAGNAFGTGWTELTTSEYNGGTNAFHVGLWARVASSEPASYTVSHDSSDSVAAILRITGWDSASGISGIVQVAPSTTGTGTTAPSAVPGGTDSLLLTFHGAETSAGGARTWTPPSGMTELVDRQSTTWTTLEVNRLSGPSNPSGTKVATPSASVDTGAACTLIINAPSSGFTGSSAVTQDDQTSSASGLAGVIGSAAVVQDDQVSSATGQLQHSGTAATTQDDQVSAATGLAGVIGSAAASQDDQASSAAGSLTFTGTASVTQADQISAASGSTLSGVTGTAAVTQDDQTSTAAGLAGVIGTGAPVQDDQASSASGALTYTGSAAVVQDDQTATASGSALSGISGSASVAQADQVSTAAGQLQHTGSAATVQDDQVATAAGSAAPGVTGAAAVVQDPQTSTAAGAAGYVGTATVAQDDQTAAATGVVAYPVTGTVAVTQDPQTSAASGTTLLAILGAAAVVQDDQLSTATGMTLAAITYRPNTGTTARAQSGITPRPFTGVTPRP